MTAAIPADENSRIMDDDAKPLQGTIPPPTCSHCRREEGTSPEPVAREARGLEGCGRILEELDRLEREKLALLKLIECGAAPWNDTGGAMPKMLKGEAEAIRALREVGEKIKRASRDLALHAA
jgi:hypothetical protein